MLYAYVFRRDGLNHAIVTDIERLDKVKRNGRYPTVCGMPIDDRVTRMVGNHPQVTVTCPTCVGIMAAILDLVEARDSAASPLPSP